ncbi:hypothetical protein PFI31113_03663 [Pandoraea fibrosis]|uniref:Restriction endonuclease type IV Mrr domain-containing protein n=2 Tax=Pandoraea fibrosis TaxID=1891094 RepID=A0A5E4X7C9_9BURK|nr:hypothetical protein PFI31113_03663 [Pandoraea fibrosis]
MSMARQHVQSNIPPSLMRCELPMWRYRIEDEDEVRCVYCGHVMDDHYDLDHWSVSFEDFASIHEEAIRDPEFPGPPPDHPHTVLRGDIVERKVCLHICPYCGWWIAEDRAVLPAMQWQYWVVTLASMSVLQDLALNDINLPLQEVRRYLMRKFEARTSIHPRLFELTVASVFRDFGYEAAATAYSNDGGVDVVLHDGSGARIGVQVKRQRRSVEVEQIRAFLGALIMGNFTSGIFVSSSRFRRGAVRAAQRSSEGIIPIELIDANRFLDMLGSVQLSHAPMPDDCGITRAKPLKFHCVNYSHLNTL